MEWLVAACGSALFAGLTSILAKLGIKSTDSDVATAIRTCVVLMLAWAMAGAAGSIGSLTSLSPRTWLFLILSGIATGASWLCYYFAIQTGVVSVVAQIDKLSLLVSIAFARLVLDERLSARSGAGLALLVAGTAVIAAFS